MRIVEDQLGHRVSDYLSPVDSTIRVEQTVREAVASLRHRQMCQTVIYFYVVDGEGRLMGVVSTRALLLADPETKIETLMTPPIVIREDATLESAMAMFAERKLLALPVVDEAGRLKGALDVQLYADEAQDVVEMERRSDMFQLIGVRLDGFRQRSPWMSYRLRMPWLACNVIGGLACAGIAAIFERVLEQVVVLAMFIPLVLTVCEAIAMQTMTMSLQFLHRPGVPWGPLGSRMKVEWLTSLLMGLTCAAVVGVLSLGWGGGGSAAGVIGMSIAVAMVAAAGFGLMGPVMLHAMRLDPKLAAGPVVLMTTDVFATTIYLGLATWWLVK
jgi:magnesium transporter